MTVQVMWVVPAWGLTFQLPQQTVIIRVASQGVFTKCSSFKILLHVKSSNVAHIKILAGIKVIFF